MASYNKRISDQSKVKFNPINRELEDRENSELDSRVNNLEKNILGSKTATGNPVTISDAAPVNAVNVSVDLEPIQAGSGTPSPDNIRPISGRSEVAIGRVGKNFIDVPNKTISSPEFVIPQLTPLKLKAGNYVFSHDYSGSSSSVALIFYDENSNEIARGSITDIIAGKNTSSVVLPSNCAYYNYYSNAVGTYSNFQLELGSTATTYEPYKGKTYTIQLGDTVYGSTLDVTRGKMVVDRGYIASYNGETLPSTWISDRDVYASGTSPTTGAQVVYELATPITIDLTPQQIKLLENTNTVYTDYEGDTITIEYQPNNAIGNVLGEVNDIYDPIIDDIYNKIASLDTRVTSLEES